MQLIPIDDSRRIWQVKDFFSSAEHQCLESYDWLNLPWSRGPSQESWKRRLLDFNHPDIKHISQVGISKLPEINDMLGTSFRDMGVNWWIDEPGFSVCIHTDGEIPCAMQIYHHVPGDQWGTCFYNFKSESHVRHQFLSTPNTGYLVLNHRNIDGSQPLHWHGMMNPVPENTWRLSSYWFFDLG